MQSTPRFHVEQYTVAILAHMNTELLEQGIEAYLVGGYLRDILLGRLSRDLDLAIQGDSVAIAGKASRILKGHFVMLDEVHQVARVVLSKHEDGTWFLDFAPLRDSIERDLSQRDFTVNAMAVPLHLAPLEWDRGDVIDPCGGIGDLDRGIIRAVSDVVFHDDPVRLLRAFRFRAELGFDIEPLTEAKIKRDSLLLAGVSGERIHEELGRILESQRAADTLRQMEKTGLLDVLIPELAASRGVEQPKEHYWDVFDHSLETVTAVERLLDALAGKNDLLDKFVYSEKLAERFTERIGNGLTRRALIKLAGLLHDVAKPETKGVDARNGRIRFLGHAQQGAKIAEGILERLRFSNREKRFVTRIIDQHLRPGHLSNAPELPTRRAIYRFFRDTGEVSVETLFLSLADHLATRGPALDGAGWLEHVEVTQYMLRKRFEEESVVSPPKLINGHIIMSELGLSPGPEIGRLLEAVREAQAAGEIESTQDALDFIRKELDRRHADY